MLKPPKVWANRLETIEFICVTSTGRTLPNFNHASCWRQPFPFHRYIDSFGALSSLSHHSLFSEPNSACSQRLRLQRSSGCVSMLPSTSFTMVYSLTYRRPSYVSFDRDSLTGEEKQKSINESVSSGSSSFSRGIPEALSFERIVKGGACPVSSN